MSRAPEALILCEGYQDRAFWAGALLHHFGCRIIPDADLYHRGSNIYNYQAQSGQVIHVAPCAETSWRNGKFVPGLGVLGTLTLKLKALATKPLTHVIVNEDVDSGTVEDREKALFGRIHAEGEATRVSFGHVRVGDVEILLMPWHVPDDALHRLSPEDQSSIPQQQSLERLVCAALCAVFPRRGEQVHAFLGSRSSPPTDHVHKSAAMTHMAGWYPIHGSFDFFQHLWREGTLRGALVELLSASSSWSSIAALAR